ncbi:sensor histidine kinase [Streptomyces sp. NBC_00459]|uniref:sensor histidine kinase n=1 Tax=Streptomyces sp. NBC_00459 TaxID=2975749 RepID=UPI002E18F7EB
MALHARTARQPKDRAPKRQLSVRTMLLVLALVPCLALVALGGMDSNHLYGDWRTVHDRNAEAKRFGPPLVTVFFNLQEERRLSAAMLADSGADRSDLTRQRELTDRSVRNLTAVGAAPSALREPFQEVTRGLKKLPGYRDAVDRRSTYQQQTFDAYTDVIASSMELFENFSNVGFGETAVLTRPALDAQWGQEMISREDAIITAGTAGGRLTGEQRFQIAEMIGSQRHIYSDKVVPQLSDTRAETYRAVLTSADWKRKTAVEQSILNTEGTGADDRTTVSASLGKKWRQSITGITPQLLGASDEYSEDLVAATEDELDDLMTHMIVNSAVSTAAVALMLFLSLRLTGTLRRRIFGLRAEALELQERLPDIVERLRKGEKVDTDAELPEIRHGDDELGQLGQALNQARGSALETAVREVELYRGFERLLQRIARRTQLLIGMQLKRLGEMQRRHEDPEVLEGLFDLDHLAARLRRYEENLVILGSGTPQRRWRRPVLLLDILRSAQGEVQDYRRIRIDTDGETWLSERAVGPMVHLLAELMENAVSFSRPPTPVEVTASQVGRGVAIEIEDRGMGMDPEQYAEANALMAAPPRMDVMSRADDARLGLYVVARLAANLGLQVELRPSSFGGTRVVVLVPAELISAGQPVQGQPVALPAAPEHMTPPAAPLPDRLALRSATSRTGRADTTRPASPAAPVPAPLTPRAATGHGGPADTDTRAVPRSRAAHAADQEGYARPLIGPWIAPSTPPARPAPAQASAPAPTTSQNPLPRRVRQASLASELREAPPSYDTELPRAGSGTSAQPLPRRTGARSGATVGAFQRQSRAARLRPDAEHQPSHQPTNPSPGPDGARKEDGR